MRKYYGKEQEVLGNRIIAEDMENIFARNYSWEQLEGKTILITGSYGMLASYIVFFLMYLRLIKGIKVNVIAQGRNAEKAKKRFGTLLNDSGLIFSTMDILCANTHILPHIDYIIHAAGIANPQCYTTNPVEVIEPNVIGTYHMLQLAKICEVEGFLFFSTGDVYGRVIESDRIDETSVGYMDPLDEHSCYGESKRLGETLCAAFYREYGIRTVMARIGHTYGPTMDIDHDPRVFASFMKSAVEGNDIILHSDGSAKRPFCYISDATAAYMLLLMNGNRGEAYNVTNTDQFLAIREVAQIIAGLPEKKINVIFRERNRAETYLDNNLNKENRPVEDKLKALGWKAEYDVKSGFERIYYYFAGL